MRGAAIATTGSTAAVPTAKYVRGGGVLLVNLLPIESRILEAEDEPGPGQLRGDFCHPTVRP
jgi:hypothetical protein